MIVEIIVAALLLAILVWSRLHAIRRERSTRAVLVDVAYTVEALAAVAHNLNARLTELEQRKDPGGEPGPAE